MTIIIHQSNTKLRLFKSMICLAMSSLSLHDDACWPTESNWITVSQPCVGHRPLWLNCCGCGVTGGMGMIWGVRPSSSPCTDRPLHQRERASESAIVFAADLTSFTPSQAPAAHRGHILPHWGHLTQRIWLFLESRFEEGWLTGRRQTVHPACVLAEWAPLTRVSSPVMNGALSQHCQVSQLLPRLFYTTHTHAQALIEIYPF